MKHRVCNARASLICALLIGFISASALADQGRFRCLDNQLLRVNADIVAKSWWGLVNRHYRDMPLESRLICVGSSLIDRAA